MMTQYWVCWILFRTPYYALYDITNFEKQDCAKLLFSFQFFNFRPARLLLYKYYYICPFTRNFTILTQLQAIQSPGYQPLTITSVGLWRSRLSGFGDHDCRPLAITAVCIRRSQVSAFGNHGCESVVLWLSRLSAFGDHGFRLLAITTVVLWRSRLSSFCYYGCRPLAIMAIDPWRSRLSSFGDHDSRHIELAVLHHI